MSLAAYKPVPDINTAAVSVQNGNASKYGKWPGLGMGMYYVQASYVDTLLTNGFTELAVGIPDYEYSDYVTDSKAFVLALIAQWARVSWGMTCGTESTMTSAKWNDFRLAVLAGAQWAQDNGVFEFRIGNECEYYIDDDTITFQH